MTDRQLLLAALDDARKIALSMVRESVVRSLEQVLAEPPPGGGLYRASTHYAKSVWMPALDAQLLGSPA